MKQSQSVKSTAKSSVTTPSAKKTDCENRENMLNARGDGKDLRNLRTRLQVLEKIAGREEKKKKDKGLKGKTWEDNRRAYDSRGKEVPRVNTQMVAIKLH